MALIFPILKKKGVDVSKALDNAEKIVDASDKIINVASDVLPGNPTVETLEIVKK